MTKAEAYKERMQMTLANRPKLLVADKVLKGNHLQFAVTDQGLLSCVPSTSAALTFTDEEAKRLAEWMRDTFLA